MLLAAFLPRAAIPAGYMPDVLALADGDLRIVICTSAGAKLVTLGADGQPIHDSQADDDAGPCVFAGLASLTAPEAKAGAMRAAFAAVDVPAPEAYGLPPVRAGPVLGSRAPPVLSATA